MRIIVSNPTLRFVRPNGDSFDDWREGSFHDVMETMRSGGTPKSSNQGYYGGEIPFLSISDITKSGKYIDLTEKTITQEGLDSCSAWVVPKYSLILAMYASYGKVCINTVPMATSQALLAMIPKPGSSLEFFYQYGEKMATIGFWDAYVKSGTQPNLSKGTIEKIKIFIPSVDEQQKIADFFSALDKKIALAERKLDNIYKLRDLLLEELLNQGIRFIGASGKHFPDWKSVTISDVSTDLSYGINAAATKFDGKHRYIRITDIDDKTHEYLSDNPVSPDKIPDSKYKLKVGDILFARTGNSVGKSYIYKAEDGDLYYAGFLIRARIREEVNPYFIYLNTLTKHYSKWVSTSSQRSGQPGINSQQYGSYVLSLPCKTEQDRIADFMLGIESKISNLKRKAYTLHQLKKALLQQMFV